MLFDLLNSEFTLSENYNYDFIIIGSGPAGITIAKKLESNGKFVALIEGGGLEETDESRKIYKGKVIGDKYFDLRDCRLRYLGGTSNHWSGMSRNFEDIDFKRDYLGEEYKWPISLKEINKYQLEASQIIEIENNFNDHKIFNSNFKSIEFHDSYVNFKDKYLDEFKRSKKIHLYYNANLKDFRGNERKINSIILESFNRKSLEISAKNFILCMGGIENSRFLLWIKEKYNNKYFDENLPIGNYWMEHPHFTLGNALIMKKKFPYTNLSLEGEVQEKLKILNCGIRIRWSKEKQSTKKLIKDILCYAPNIGKKFANYFDRNLICGAKIRAAWEQAPNIDSQIILDKDKDFFGIPRPVLNWKKTNLDRRTVLKTLSELNTTLIEKDLGRLQLDNWIIKNEEYPDDDELGGNHHMGGTRMHDSKKYGVVDSNCKVYGSKNLFISGSSVFTTGGHNNPTFPIVMFSIRLANHLLKI